MPYPSRLGAIMSSARILLGALEDDPTLEQPKLRFRLVYEGELKSGQKDPENGQHDRLAEHKQSIRKEFHRQLKHLWETNKFLKEHSMYLGEDGSYQPVANRDLDCGEYVTDKRVPMSEAIAHLFRENGYRFVPLVRENLSLLCSLDILFLRRDHPGSVISAGDLDNRIKTIIDALRKPKGANELRGNETPADGEDPFFVLLEDDDLVTKLSVDTDALLEPPVGNKEADRRMVKLVITVELKPYDVTLFNLSFA